MTTEQKAKAYDEAIKEAAIAYKDEDKHLKATLERIFPKLKEREDGKIIKWLIEGLRNSVISSINNGFDIDMGKMALAWLEKQSEQRESSTTIHYWTEEEIEPIISDYLRGAEHYGGMIGRLRCLKPKSLENEGGQKPFDYENANIQQKDFAPKVEPKFHKGEWLCENEPNNYARFIQILETVNVQGKERYRISRDIHNNEDVVEFDFVEKYYHKFDIKDARDGDVLVCPLPKGYENGEQIFMFKSINSRDYVDDCIEYYCRVCEGVFYENENGYMGTTSSPLYPATKEQREQLEKAMADAGFTFDFDKKELKKIKKNTAWSEEDEKIFRALSGALARISANTRTDSTSINYSFFSEIEWLRSLKERVGNFDDGYKVGFSAAKHNQWKPSEDQMEALVRCVDYLEDSDNEDLLVMESLLEQLKELC